MSSLIKDPINNAIFDGIWRGVKVMVENKCYGSAIILIYSGIDTMAFLSMPENQESVTRKDFIKWVNDYIRFTCTEQLTGEDFYGARCAMVHSYCIDSNSSRNGKCRRIGYVDNSIPEVSYNPTISKDLVILSVTALAEAFFNGVYQFLIDSYKDKSNISVFEKRLVFLVQNLPYDCTY